MKSQIAITTNTLNRFDVSNHISNYFYCLILSSWNPGIKKTLHFPDKYISVIAIFKYIIILNIYKDNSCFNSFYAVFNLFVKENLEVSQ